MNIAVVTASKNPLTIYGEAIIKQSLESLQNQTYPNWHLYLVNYGNLEETKQIAQYLPAEKITILDLKITSSLVNLFTAALNFGLETSTEPLIARLDLDDWSLPERFEKQIHFLTQSPQITLVGTMASIFRKGQLTPLGKPSPIWSHFDILNNVRRCNPFVHGSVMFRRNPILKEVGYYDTTYTTAQDFDYWCRIMSKFPVANLPDRLYVWRDFAGSISNKNPHEGSKNKGIALRKWGTILDQKLRELQYGQIT